ncbi:MAG: hypothetical protein K2J90_06320 [Lachnospiraceae bacterium]|nr:hypothetical protein [Lachnospiraceae bacterium]
MNKLTGIQGNSQGMFTVNANRAGRLDADSLKEQAGSKKKNSTVFAGDLNMGQDSILAKKQRAQKEAMKMLKDVFDADMKTDVEQKAREQHIEEMKRQNEKAKSGLKDIEDMQDNLMEQYGLTEDSQEQKDLELVRKVRNSKDPFAKDKLTKEEQERYEKITEQGLTEYQERVLSLDEAAEELQGVMADNEKEIAIEEDTIKNTDMQRMKKHPMKDAAKNAAKYLEAARKDMISDLYNESKEHIDEKIEEAKEEQKEKAEEKKEEEKEEAVREAKELEREIMLQKAQENTQEHVEEQIAKAKNRGQVSMQNQINGDILGEISDGADKSAEIDQKIKDLLDKLSLLQEDLKGAAVNDTV